MTIRLQHPLPGATQTSSFGWREGFTENGVHVPSMLHNGQDFGAPAGTPIRAAHPGQVIWSGWDPIGGGWGIQLMHDAGWGTLYFHMSHRSTDVTIGQRVSTGQTIGRVGMSGLATGAHLHFMLRINGSFVDPLPYLNSTPLPPAKKETPDMANKAAGFQYTRKADGAIVYLVLHDPGSGIYHEYTDGGKGVAMGGLYNNPVSLSFGAGSYAPITEGHAAALKAAEDQALTAKVTLTPVVTAALNTA